MFGAWEVQGKEKKMEYKNDVFLIYHKKKLRRQKAKKIGWKGFFPFKKKGQKLKKKKEKKRNMLRYHSGTFWKSNLKG